MNQDDKILEHFGVKGMKWGRRKVRQKSRSKKIKEGKALVKSLLNDFGDQLARDLNSKSVARSKNLAENRRKQVQKANDPRHQAYLRDLERQKRQRTDRINRRLNDDWRPKGDWQFKI